MPRPIRRAERAMPEAEAREILIKGQYGVLSTASAEGQPYGVPISYCYLNEAIYFHCAVEGHKLDNLATNNRVSFCVVGSTELLPDKFSTRYESSVAFGRTVELQGDEKRAALEAILKKYSPNFLESGMKYIESDIHKTRVFKIQVESLTGKSRK
jgi:uncharacterized protein